MGWISDHTRSRWGRKRPYLLFGALGYAFTYFLIWTVPELPGSLWRFAYSAAAIIAFNTLFTVVFVPYTSLTAAMTTDYHERTELTVYRMAASQVAFLIGAVVPSAAVAWLAGAAGQSWLDAWGINALFGSWAGTPRQSYLLVALCFAGVMLTAIWVSFAGTRERDLAGTGGSGSPCRRLIVSDLLPQRRIRETLKVLQTNQAYRLAVLMILLTNTGTTLIGVNLPYYLQYALELKADQTLILGALFCTSVVSLPLWLLATRRFGKAETYQGLMVVYSFVVCALYFVPPGDRQLTLILAMLAGAMFGGALLIPWAMVPDVVEFDQWQSGKRREGLLYGGTTFSYKLSSALAVFVSGGALQFLGYVPGGLQELRVLVGIRFLIGVAPAVIFLVVTYLAVRYPLTAERHGQIVRELELRRKEAEDLDGQ